MLFQRKLNCYYKSKGRLLGQKESKKTTVKRSLSKDKQQGSQKLQKDGDDGSSIHCSAVTISSRRKAAKHMKVL